MSFDITLEGAGPVERFTEGGTYALGGSTTADLNVTYNYTDVTHLIGFSFETSLHGKKAADCISELERVVDLLGTYQYKDYWAPTPGNAGYAASILLRWAKQYPDAVFQVS